jgi:pilus assembly protein CpaF
MFTIIISEKGGAERREAFEKNEINVGRVQGNDLMLAKGNVSKHHARLLYRDGRFIVTDLKSTNCTYVNGRKISQATIVREGDKIYVGDFVLRLETAAPSSSPPEMDHDSQGHTPAYYGASSRDGKHPPVPPSSAASRSGGLTTQHSTGFGGAPSDSSTPRSTESQSVSHYPLERDPDDSQSGPELGTEVAATVGSAHPPRSGEGTAGRAATAYREGARGATAPIPNSSAPQAGGRRFPGETAQQATRRLALTTLVDRVGDTLDTTPPFDAALFPDPALALQIERTAREQASAMRSDGEAPEGIDLELLVQDALNEFVGLGPIGKLLEDDDTSEVHVSRPDSVLAVKTGRALLAEPSFTSEKALARVVARLVYQSGQPLQPTEVVVERRFARGIHLVAISPLGAGGWVLSLRKRRRVDVRLEELVRTGGVPQAIASFLEACVAARANVLVVAPDSGLIAAMASALASAVSSGQRVAVLQDAEEIAIPHSHVIPIWLIDRGPRGEESVRAATRLGADRVIVVSLAGSAAVAMIDAIGEGCEGVIAGMGAPSLRHGLARLASQVALSRPGTSLEVAREAVGESFDIAVEIARTSDAVLRVQRVSELVGVNDHGVAAQPLWVLGIDASGQSQLVSTGAVPRRLLDDFVARGVKFDGALFKRR